MINDVGSKMKKYSSINLSKVSSAVEMEDDRRSSKVKIDMEVDGDVTSGTSSPTDRFLITTMSDNRDDDVVITGHYIKQGTSTIIQRDRSQEGDSKSELLERLFSYVRPALPGKRCDVAGQRLGFCGEQRAPNKMETAEQEVPVLCDDNENIKSHPSMDVADFGKPNVSIELEDIEKPDQTDSATDYSIHGGRCDIREDEPTFCGDQGKCQSICRVCGDQATGMYFGALVCVPCKTFFLRYAGDGFSFVCKANGDCQISASTRTQCKYCRYQKCLQAGMCRRVRPAQVQVGEGQQLCVVCSDVGNGVHFGALTCEGCKKFFRRGLTENSTYTCKSKNNCVINPRTRNSCRYCRYQKCLKVGMCREAIQMGRPSKLPSNASRNVGNRPHVHLRPSNRNVDSSGLESSRPSVMEKCQMENLSQALSLQQSENWTSSRFCDHSQFSQRVRNSNSSASEESQIDIDNVEGIFQISTQNRPASGSHMKYSSSLPSVSHSDVTQQPDSTVLSPAEIIRTEEHDESFFSAENSLYQRNDNSIMKHIIIPSQVTGKVLKDMKSGKIRQKGISGEEAVGGSRKVPDKFLLRPHSGNIEEKINSVPLLMASRTKDMKHDLKSGFAFLDQRIFSSSATLPLSKENDSKMRNLEQPIQKESSLENSISERPAGSCSSPSITSSSITSDVLHQEVNHNNEVMNCALNHSESTRPESKGLCQRSDSVEKFDIESLVATSRVYWLQPWLPDQNVLFTDMKHWEVIHSIVPTYDRFVQMSNTINRTLKSDFEEWRQHITDPADDRAIVSEWIKQKVIPAYTIASVTYCKKLPGFSDFHSDDQITIIRLGQSPSRILVAALHWYDADQKNFRNFLSWRDKKPGQLDLFKQKLIEYAEDIMSLELDPIEGALLNALLITATDYPNLVRADIINDARKKILATFRAYTTAKFGTPNNRLESLFSHIPELRRLGLLHHLMTTTRTMTAEEVEYLTSGRALDSEMVLNCQPSSCS